MESILSCKSLTKKYAAAPALDGLNLELAPGRIVGLLGPNGSGKTTLIKLAAGLLTPTVGEISICGLPIGVETKKIVSYLPDRAVLSTSMRVADTVAFYAEFYEDFDAKKAIEMLSSLKLTPQQKIGEMSKGMREKMQLCLAMSRAARLYLLDEPLGGVDPAARDFILETIIKNYSEKATLLLSTHLIGDIENVLDDVVMIANGRLLAHETVDTIREQHGKSVDSYFREVFRC